MQRRGLGSGDAVLSFRGGGLRGKRLALFTGFVKASFKDLKVLCEMTPGYNLSWFNPVSP